jgi:hypothetical protein
LLLPSCISWYTNLALTAWASLSSNDKTMNRPFDSCLAAASASLLRLNLHLSPPPPPPPLFSTSARCLG